MHSENFFAIKRQTEDGKPHFLTALFQTHEAAEQSFCSRLPDSKIVPVTLTEQEHTRFPKGRWS